MSSHQNLLTTIGTKLQLTAGLIEGAQNQKNSEMPEDANAITRNYQNPSLLAIRYLRLKKVMKRRSAAIF